MRLILSSILVLLTALSGSAYAQTPTALDVATISMTNATTPKLVSNSACYTDGNDLACDRGVYLLPGGTVSATNISVTRISGDGSQLTNLPAAAASPTNVPAFRVYNSANQTVAASTWTKIQFNTEFFDTYNNFDNTTNYRFQPTVPGKYIITLNIGCSATPCYGAILKNGVESLSQFNGGNNIGSAGSTVVDLNGTTDYVEGWGYVTGGTTITGAASNVTNMSGSLLASGNGLISGSSTVGATRLASLTDVSLSSAVSTGQVLMHNGISWTNSNISLTLAGYEVVNATLNNPGTGWFYANCPSGKKAFGGACGTSNGSVSTNGQLSSNNYGCYAHSSGYNWFAYAACAYATTTAGNAADTDRITSGTVAALVNSTGYISLSTASSTWGYFGSADSYLPRLTTTQVSATTISTTAVQIFSPTTALACSSSTAGTIRYNSPTTTLELCTGSGWQPMGVGVPAGTISAFASTTCPTGWSEYTAARGRFLRGIDNGAGNDPSGTRAPGATQADAFRSHIHTGVNYAGTYVNPNVGGSSLRMQYALDGIGTSYFNVDAAGGAETRPTNVAVTFCQFNGTSNGWNNPLSGGSTSAAGSTGAVQYNTSGSFDGSTNFTWSNASSTLGVTGLTSTTSITVGGRTLEQYIASSSTATGDRITSGTTSVVANSATNTISFSVAGVNTGYMNGLGQLSVPGIGIGRAPSATLPFIISATGWMVKLGLGDAVPNALMLSNNQIATVNQPLYINYSYSSDTLINALGGNVGVRTQNPSTSLHVSGTLRIADGGEACDANRAGAIRYTSASIFQTCNGGGTWSAIGSGGIASPTNVPAFRVYNSSNQTVAGSTWTKIVFDTEQFDTYNNFDSVTNSRFQPTVAGKYIITLNVGCDGASCFGAINKNGGQFLNHFSGGSNLGSAGSTIVDMNGTTDYIEGWGFVTGGTTITGASVHMTNMTGSLLASGNGLISGSTALSDRITSGTVAALVNGTGYISLSTASSTWGYFGSADSYLPRLTTAQVSATTISTTAVQIFSPTTALACSSSTAGTIRYNSPTTTLELCTGSGWQPMGVGVPAGTISAFASTTCPTGWSEYTAARGRFLRGIDNGAGNDPDGTRAPGSAQLDSLKDHQHYLKQLGTTNINGGAMSMYGPSGSYADTTSDITGAGGGVETRPKNVAVIYCQFNGTSNGWNNPLSGGSTTAAGSTGQVQYNTSNAFDASPNFTWSNASSTLRIIGAVSSSQMVTNDVKLTGAGGNCSTAADEGRMYRSPTSRRLQVCKLY